MPTPRRSTTHTASLLHACMLTAIALAFACIGVSLDTGGLGSAGGSVVSSTSTTDASMTSDSSSTSATADSTAADSTGILPLDECLCAAPELGQSCGADELAAWVPGCPDAAPCARLSVECPRPGVDLYDCTSELVFDEAAMQCVLEALQDGTLGRFELDGHLHYGFSSAQPLYLLHVLEGRVAVQAGCMEMGSVVVQTFPPSLHTLAEPGYFTECMAVEVPRYRYECLLEGIGDGAELLVCPS